MKMLIALLALVFAVTAFAFPSGYQTQELYDVKVAVDSAQTDLDTVESQVGFAYQTLGTLDISVTGTVASAATVEIGNAIPASSVITNVYSYVETQVVSANDNTIALGCESATDLDGASDMTDITAGTVTAGAVLESTGLATYVVSDGCQPTITVGAGASGITAGKVSWVIHYTKVE